MAAFRAALLERTRSRVPFAWANTQNNLGAALRALGEREAGAAGTARLQEAVTAFRGALEVLETASDSYPQRIVKKSLQTVERLLADRSVD